MRPGAALRGARRAGRAALAPLALTLGCAPTGHTVEPYASDPARAAALEEEARRRCAGTPAMPRVPPERPFATDGCSVWPDRAWGVDCCVEHDARYWCGGSAEERLRADRALRACVARSASGWLAGLMYRGVRVGGHPIFPVPWRWGFGRPWPAGYDDQP